MLRIGLAILVMFSHCYRLGGFGVDPLQAILGQRHTIGMISVGMFFVLSGFLITRSGLNSPSLGRFLWHRFLRIFPGYWACLIVTALVFAPVLFWLDHGDVGRLFRVGRDAPLDYIKSNLWLLHFNAWSIAGILNFEHVFVTGVIPHNPFPLILNGSLWRLPYEFACYLVVGGVAVVGILRRARGIVLGLFLILWALHVFSSASPHLFKECFPYQSTAELVMLSMYFTAGSTCFLYRDKIPFAAALFIVALFALGLGIVCDSFDLFAPLAMSYAFLWLAFKLPLSGFERHGDFSYGIYIYAFPVQQGLAFLKVQEGGFGLYLLWALLITIILAVFSYRFIEAPCLKFKHLNVPVRLRGFFVKKAWSKDPATGVA